MIDCMSSLYVQVGVGSVGVVGNLLCILTFSRMSVQKNFHRWARGTIYNDKWWATCSVSSPLAECSYRRIFTGGQWDNICREILISWVLITK